MGARSAHNAPAVRQVAPGTAVQVVAKSGSDSKTLRDAKWYSRIGRWGAAVSGSLWALVAFVPTVSVQLRELGWFPEGVLDDAVLVCGLFVLFGKHMEKRRLETVAPVSAEA